MSRVRRNRALIAFAECIELYAHRNRLMLRLEMEDYEAAFLLCQEAAQWCEGLLHAAVSPQERERYRRDLENLYLLQVKIAETAALESSRPRFQQSAAPP